MRKEFTNDQFKLVNDKSYEYQGDVLNFESKSKMMLDLYDKGVSIADIQRFMSCHYSFVYGVISSHRSIDKVKSESKSDVIRELSDSGLTVGQIAKQLNCNYSFVHTVVKKHKAANEVAE